MRGLGGANLALAVVTLYAILRPSAGLVHAVAGAMLVAPVAHFAYHVTHLDLLPTVLDRARQTVSLALLIVAPLAVFIGAGRIRPARTRPSTPLEAAVGRSTRLLATSQS